MFNGGGLNPTNPPLRTPLVTVNEGLRNKLSDLR